MSVSRYLIIKGNKQGQFTSSGNKIAVSSFQWGMLKTVAGANKISIGGNRTENVDSNQTISVGSARTENVGANQTITVGQASTETVGANETISIGANRVILTIAKSTGPEDSQFFRALVLGERLEIQYGPEWKGWHRSIFTSAVITRIRTLGRQKEITFQFIPHRIAS